MVVLHEIPGPSWPSGGLKSRARVMQSKDAEDTIARLDSLCREMGLMSKFC
jgi:hypothetical protein